jgi:hypothetical protein
MNIVQQTHNLTDKELVQDVASYHKKFEQLLEKVTR